MTIDRIKMRRLCLEQLVWEHRQVCWLYRVTLPTPVFEVSSGQQRAGAWSDSFNCLSIASWVIEDHAWDVVIELLKHEMAHQYVCQAMVRGDETAHGPAFQEACDRLGVHPEFRAAQGAIPRLLKTVPQKTIGHPILNKVEKLFSLAKSANRHEATLAMQKANALLRKHNLERLRSLDSADYDYLVIQTHKKRISAQTRLIAGLLKNFFYVNVVIHEQFSAKTGKICRVIELTGARENLTVAEYTYHFLARRIQNLWEHYRKQRNAGSREKNSYQIGILKGFEEKLQTEEEKDPQLGDGATHSSLVCASDPGLIRYYHSRYPRLKKVRRAGPRLRADTYEAGQQQGRNIVLHKGISASDGNQGALLPDA